LSLRVNNAFRLLNQKFHCIQVTAIASSMYCGVPLLPIDVSAFLVEVADDVEKSVTTGVHEGGPIVQADALEEGRVLVENLFNSWEVISLYSSLRGRRLFTDSDK